MIIGLELFGLDVFAATRKVVVDDEFDWFEICNISAAWQDIEPAVTEFVICDPASSAWLPTDIPASEYVVCAPAETSWTKIEVDPTTIKRC